MYRLRRRSIPPNPVPRVTPPRPLLRSAVLVHLGMMLCCVPVAQAQPSLGVRAGVVASTLAGGDTAELGGRVGILVGAFARLGGPGAIAIQPEVVVSQRNVQLPGGTAASRVSMYYLDVPLLAVVAPAIAGYIQPSLHFGPQVSVLLSSDIEAGSDLQSSEDLRDIDLAVVAGIEVGSYLAGRREAFGVGIRYALGLREIRDADPASGGALPAARHRGFAVTAFFRF